MLKIKNVYTRDRHKMNFVPFIDVVFMLLMYFFVAAEIRPTEADFVTNMPAGRGIAERKLEKKDVINLWVADTPSGPIVRLGGENGQAYTFKDLVWPLKKAAGPNSLVVIDGPTNVSIQTVSYALDAAVEAGIPSMTFSDPEIKKIKAGMIP
jgi:biopolymer transport protein ExbD